MREGQGHLKACYHLTILSCLIVLFSWIIVSIIQTISKLKILFQNHMLQFSKISKSETFNLPENVVFIVFSRNNALLVKGALTYQPDILEMVDYQYLPYPKPWSIYWSILILKLGLIQFAVKRQMYAANKKNYWKHTSNVFIVMFNIDKIKR